MASSGLQRGQRPSNLDLRDISATKSQDSVQDVFTILDWIRNALRHPPVENNTPREEIFETLHVVAQALDMLDKTFQDPEFRRHRREMWPSDLKRKLGYLMNLLTELMDDCEDEDTRAHELRNLMQEMYDETELFRRAFIEGQSGFDPNIDTDAMEREAQNWEPFVPGADSMLRPSVSGSAFKTFLQTSRSDINTLQTRHGGEFGSMAYQNFLRDNIKPGSKLMLWRDTPVRGSLAPPASGGHTLIVSSDLEDDSFHVEVEIEGRPNHPYCYVDLASVFLLLPCDDDSRTDIVAKSFNNAQYREYLVNNMEYGSTYRLWRDDQYSGLRAGDKVMIRPEATISRGAEIMPMTLVGDPTDTSYNVSLASLCVDLPYYIDVSHLGEDPTCLESCLVRVPSPISPTLAPRLAPGVPRSRKPIVYGGTTPLSSGLQPMYRGSWASAGGVDGLRRGGQHPSAFYQTRPTYSDTQMCPFVTDGEYIPPTQGPAQQPFLQSHPPHVYADVRVDRRTPSPSPPGSPAGYSPIGHLASGGGYWLPAVDGQPMRRNQASSQSLVDPGNVYTGEQPRSTSPSPSPQRQNVGYWLPFMENHPPHVYADVRVERPTPSPSPPPSPRMYSPKGQLAAGGGYWLPQVENEERTRFPFPPPAAMQPQAYAMQGRSSGHQRSGTNVSESEV